MVMFLDGYVGFGDNIVVCECCFVEKFVVWVVIVWLVFGC